MSCIGLYHLDLRGAITRYASDLSAKALHSTEQQSTDDALTNQTETPDDVCGTLPARTSGWRAHHISCESSYSALADNRLNAIENLGATQVRDPCIACISA